MDEVYEFCARVLGAGEQADKAAAKARGGVDGDRVALLAAAARACREQTERRPSEPPPEPPVPADFDGAGPQAGAAPGLAATIARELSQATAKLPERQREALALRELLRLSHEQIARVLQIDQSAVAPLLARARLRLRVQRRGVVPEPGPPCPERDRALRVLTRRQDSEPLSAKDETWVLDHLVTCASCTTAHAAMLESSVCYRAWER
ncbi:MAG: hypothetical protein DLM64_11365 [Solirubrobacterales bacterium]|nr:MAG: hypothetical protein DLM64_11365 [Solirubrobacterales bacterium]